MSTQTGQSARELAQDLNPTQAVEEITCTFMAARLVYLQHVRFAIGGKHSVERGLSPRAIQAVWGPNMGTHEDPGPPEWVKLSRSLERTFPFEIRVVTLDYAVGRIARLAIASWNALSSNELLDWAENINPAAIRLEHPYLPTIPGAPTGRYARVPKPDEESDVE